MTNTSDRIEALEQENQHVRDELAALVVRVTALEPKPVPVRQPERPIVQGFYTPRVPAHALPSESEFVELQKIVLKRFPILVPRGPQALSPPEFHVHFKRGFAWLLIAQRRADLNKTYDVSYFAKQAAAFTRDDVGLKPFLAGVVAIGDIAYSDFTDFPYGISIALAADCFRDLERVGDLTSGWHRVLDEKLLAPVQLA